MHLKSVKILLFVLLSLTVACLLIGGGLSKPAYFLLAAAFAAGYAIAYAALWRCPYCGRHFGRGDGETCQHGEKVLDPGEERPGGEKEPRSAVRLPAVLYAKETAPTGFHADPAKRSAWNEEEQSARIRSLAKQGFVS